MDLLLVEDDELILESLTAVLSDAGYNMLCSASAEAALEMVYGNSPDVVVTDINLGPGMNGLALGRLARARWPDVAIIYISGRYAELRGLGRRERFVAKPFGATALLRTIKDAQHDRLA